MIRLLCALVVLAALLHLAAYANISGGIGQNIGGGIGGFDQGVNGGGGGKPLAACGNGTIDLSKGCTLGVLP
jgi:hypothetical protein